MATGAIDSAVDTPTEVSNSIAADTSCDKGAIQSITMLRACVLCATQLHGMLLQHMNAKDGKFLHETLHALLIETFASAETAHIVHGSCRALHWRHAHQLLLEQSIKNALGVVRESESALSKVLNAMRSVCHREIAKSNTTEIDKVRKKYCFLVVHILIHFSVQQHSNFWRHSVRQPRRNKCEVHAMRFSPSCDELSMMIKLKLIVSFY